MKKHIVCFGDSNTHGYCADPNDSADRTDRFNEDERWTCLLQKALGEEYLVLEEGLSGRTTVFSDPLHECMSGLDVIYSTLMSHEPVDLLKAMYSIYSRGGRSPEPDISAAVPKRIIYSVRDKSLQILHRLRDGCASLNEIYRNCRSRSEVVAAFMSILELCSMGSIHISRTENDYSLEFVGGDMDSIIDKIVE